MPQAKVPLIRFNAAAGIARIAGILRKLRTVLYPVFLLAALALSASSAKAQFLYVHDDSFGGNRIFAFSVAPNGALTPVPGSPFATGGIGQVNFDVGSITIASVSNRVYSTNRGSSTVSGFSVNPNGSLTPVPGSPFALSQGAPQPIGVASSADGKFLFVGRGFTFGPGSGVDAFSIAADGSLTLVGGSPFGIGSGGNGFDVIFDPLRNHVITNQNNNQVGVFNVGLTGTLTQIPGSPFNTPTFNNHKMALSPNGNLLFVGDGGSSSASVMLVDGVGALTNAVGSPVGTIPQPIGTTVHPTGQFVYFGSGFSAGANIGAFSIGAGGALTGVPGQPFLSGGSGPSGLVTDGAGSFLFAVNTASASIGVLSIAGNGALTPVIGSPFAYTPVGDPTGIVFLKPPGAAFDICLQDETTRDILRINSTTGDYQFVNCSSGLTIGGTGTLTQRGGIITLQDNRSDRRIVAKIDSSSKRATAGIQIFSPSPERTFTIADRDITNNSCACP